MDKQIMIIVIVILIAVYGVLVRNEFFEKDISTKSKNSLNTIYNDTLFDDTITFNNTPDELGIEICYKKCKGQCVEYGPTGIAHCFPTSSPILQTSYGDRNLVKIQKEPNDKQSWRL